MANKLDFAMQILHGLTSKPKLWTPASMKFLCTQCSNTSTETLPSNEVNKPIDDKRLLPGWKVDKSLNPSVQTADTTFITDSSLKSTLEPASTALAPIGATITSKQIHKVGLLNQIEGHVARQLSRHKITPEELKVWTQTASNFKHNDNPIPSIPTISYPAPFEVAALKKIHKLSFTYNTVFEVRDATVPCSSHHPSFSRLAYHRKHLICYTHADMLDEATIKRIADWTKKSWYVRTYVRK